MRASAPDGTDGARARQAAGAPAAGVLAAGALALALMLALALVFAAGAARAAPSFPPLTGRVVDDAHVLPADVQASLTQKLADLEARTGRQLVVVTLPSLQGDVIEDYGYQLGRAWGIGRKGKDNGVLFIVAPNEHKVRIEVGYELEPVLTDALSEVILQQSVLPKFRQGDIAGGVVDGTDALIRQLELDVPAAEANVAQANAERAAEAQAAQTRPVHHETLGTIFSILLVVFVLGAFFRGGRRGGGMGWALPLMFMGSSFGGRGRDDDFGGGGFGGGGGFSGGGGSFGGGGASGGW